MNDNSLGLRGYTSVLIRRWPFVVAMPVLAAAAALIISQSVKPTYEATAVIALSPATLSVPTTGQAPPYYLMVNAPSQLPAAYTPAYYVALLNGADVVAAAAPQAPVSIASDANDKSLIDITARGGDPQQVAATANGWMKAGLARIRSALLPKGDSVQAAALKLSEAERALIKFSQDNDFPDYDLSSLRLETFSSVETQIQLNSLLRTYDTAQSVYLDFAKDAERQDILAASAYAPAGIPAAVPAAPVSPQLARNTASAAGLGLLVGVLAAFVVEYVSPGGHGRPARAAE